MGRHCPRFARDSKVSKPPGPSLLAHRCGWEPANCCLHEIVARPPGHPTPPDFQPIQATGISKFCVALRERRFVRCNALGSLQVAIPIPKPIGLQSGELSYKLQLSFSGMLYIQYSFLSQQSTPVICVPSPSLSAPCMSLPLQCADVRGVDRRELLRLVFPIPRTYGEASFVRNENENKSSYAIYALDAAFLILFARDRWGRNL